MAWLSEMEKTEKKGKKEKKEKRKEKRREESKTTTCPAREVGVLQYMFLDRGRSVAACSTLYTTVRGGTPYIPVLVTSLPTYRSISLALRFRWDRRPSRTAQSRTEQDE